MTSKLDLPCGHKIDDESASRISTSTKNFYTCRNTGDHVGCEPAVQYYSDPFHWTRILPRNRAAIPPASTEEQTLRERLKEMVRNRMKTKVKQ